MIDPEWDLRRLEVAIEEVAALSGFERPCVYWTRIARPSGSIDWAGTVSGDQPGAVFQVFAVTDMSEREAKRRIARELLRGLVLDASRVLAQRGYHPKPMPSAPEATAAIEHALGLIGPRW